MLSDDTWHMYLLNLASMPDCLAHRPAIRNLYYAGYETDWIAETCGIDVEIVRDALLRIP